MRNTLRALGIVLALGGPLALGACATPTNQTAAASQQQTSAQSVFASTQAYTVAAREEARLISSGTVRGGAAVEMKRLDNAAYAALVPLRNAARSGLTVNGTDLASAQAALSAFQTYVVEHGGKVTP